MTSKHWASVAGAALAIGMLAPAATAFAATGSTTLSPSVTTTTTIPGPLSEPGLLPTSPLYFLNSLWQSVELFFTFSSTGKAHLLVHFAEVEASQAASLAKSGNTSLATLAIQQFTADMKSAAGLAGSHAGPTLAQDMAQAITAGHLLSSFVSGLHNTTLLSASTSLTQQATQDIQQVTNVSKVEGTLVSQTQVTLATGPAPTPGSNSTSNGSGNSVGNGLPQGTSTGTSTSTVMLDLTSGQFPVATSVWVLKDNGAYGTGLLEPGQRVNATLVNGVVVVIRVQGEQDWATYQGPGTAPATISLSYGSGPTATDVPLAAGAVIKIGDHNYLLGSRTALPSTFTVGSAVRVTYNTMGQVTQISLPGDGHGKAGQQPQDGKHSGKVDKKDGAKAPSSSSSAIGSLTIRGTVTTVSATSISVNGTTYPVATGATVKGGDHTLSLAQIPVGAPVRLTVVNGTVDTIQLHKLDGIQGTVSAITSSTITVNGTVYTLSPSVRITGNNPPALSTLVGTTVKLKFNAVDQVKNIKLSGKDTHSHHKAKKQSKKKDHKHKGGH